MTDNKRIAIDAIEEKSDIFIKLSDEIWEYAELSLKEFRSAQAYVKLLSELGFEVEERVCGIPTAFFGKWGRGKPIIGILGEFDALSGLSQVGGSSEKNELVKGGNGHGCGHNLLGAGALAAAYGIKEYLKATDKEGTVIFYGTPGEEGGAGKAFMAKESIWRDLDCALTWHPSDVNEVSTGTCNSCIQTLYKFKGIASHAAGDPEHGRSALDAVELMNVGVQYLREHMPSTARIHYSIVDGGGLSPNVVQPTASVLYMVRSPKVRDALELQARVDKIAEGATLMTECECERVFIDGCSGTVPNHTLERVLYDNMTALCNIEYTDEEWNFANAIKQTYKSYVLPSMAALYDTDAKQKIAELTCDGKRAINDFAVPICTADVFSPGSTDVGDVSWQTPTAQVYTSCFTSGAPGHSWQNVSLGKTTIAYKGMLCAAKILSSTAVDIFEDHGILSAAKEEFFSLTKEGYVSPIPDGEIAKAIEM